MGLWISPLSVLTAAIRGMAAIHIIQTSFLQIAPTRGPSMMPTFSVDSDWAVVDMTSARNRRKNINVGDLILYKIPVDGYGIGVKRVLGLPGDFVSLGTPEEHGEEKMIQVPEGHCWIVGDNLTVSRDSRQYGPLPLALVSGKVTARILPRATSGWFRNPLQPVE